ncbi:MULTISPECIES: TVP38/TMEM64 family protein [unclassified Caulobacter]|uniref:TVP38/TMEM64 family protein n=1 Tax=unclassified Caulobacter TaxID=2648921 RepID=UPI000D356611|nr:MULTISPECIES: TVP38/TMEM64 family protein [unclassified Caulobacter]PTS83232.1 TVP38/TMEM64 family protein [Caulobacter sp. HMWF009]PTT06675.1 TVP38/TMEM64 family protein [Caulobacter sp. HMWF025]
MTGPGALGLLRRYGPVALLVALLVTALVSGLAEHLSLEELRAQGESLREFARQRPVLSVLIYLTVYVATVSISLPGALILSLSGGYLFGPFLGGAAAVSGATGGSTVVYLVCKTAFGDFLRRWKNPLLLKVEDGFRENAFAYLLTLRLIPAFPLLLVNVAAGLMEVPFGTFLSASFLGMLPSSFVYAGIGSGLGHVFAQSGPVSLDSLMSPRVYLPIIGMGALAFLPPLWRHWRRGRVAPAPDVK